MESGDATVDDGARWYLDLCAHVQRLSAINDERVFLTSMARDGTLIDCSEADETGRSTETTVYRVSISHETCGVRNVDYPNTTSTTIQRYARRVSHQDEADRHYEGSDGSRLYCDR